MRQIMFRAWDKERNEMRQVQLMDWSDWWVSTGHTWEREPSALEFGERNSFKNELTDRHIIMQYTGLTDRNGTPIYEGDICKTKYFTGVVEWWECGYAIKVDDNSWTGMQGELEVNGNIYEHPHLLETKEVST